jgi:uncharacterized membrane protein HdeD (DUF308 family)
MVATAQQICSGCGTPVAAANVLYTADARIVCAKCYAAADIVETDKRHAHAIRNAAIASSLAGLLTVFSPLSGFIFVVIACGVAAVASGVYAVNAMSFGQERFTKHLTPGDRVLVWICSIVGIGLGAFFTLMMIAGVALLF